jgi:hypothetical protein
MTHTGRLSPPASGGRVLIVAGAVAGTTAVLLYVTALSRAVGVVVGVVALVAVALGVVTARTRRWPARPVVYVLGAALVALVIFGIALFVYALGHQPATA